MKISSKHNITVEEFRELLKYRLLKNLPKTARSLDGSPACVFVSASGKRPLMRKYCDAILIEIEATEEEHEDIARTTDPVDSARMSGKSVLYIFYANKQIGVVIKDAYRRAAIDWDRQQYLEETTFLPGS